MAAGGQSQGPRLRDPTAPPRLARRRRSPLRHDQSEELPRSRDQCGRPSWRRKVTHSERNDSLTSRKMSSQRHSKGPTQLLRTGRQRRRRRRRKRKSRRSGPRWRWCSCPTPALPPA
ncbi:uncharacterized protein LOC126099150 [Schistocerca cancellata]|uniref:uncharacterized protein LOC126099150 n=1 Tax=Schistocerca cancellata TaxID=274614 RepID=UPI0021179EB3|nr:uncharacterized protein LOC126099150 [Schistocerca cancellata]